MSVGTSATNVTSNHSTTGQKCQFNSELGIREIIWKIPLKILKKLLSQIIN
jgi:hypothetical protein